MDIAVFYGLRRDCLSLPPPQNIYGLASRPFYFHEYMPLCTIDYFDEDGEEAHLYFDGGNT